MRRVWLVGSLLLVAPHVHAEEKTANITLAGDFSATDNAFSAPASGERKADLYAQIRPGILFGYATPRSTYEGLVEGEVLDYLRNNEQLAFTFRGALRAQYQTGPESDVSFNAGGSTGKLNTLANRTTPDATVVSVVPTSNSAGVDVYQADGGQQFGMSFLRTLRFTEGLSARWSKTRDPAGAETESSEGGLELAIDKAWEDNSLTFGAGANVTRLVRYTPATDTTMLSGSIDRALQPHATVSWRHDWTLKWSSVLSGGVGLVMPYGEDDYNPGRELASPTIAPLASATLAYTDAWGYANFGVAHSLTPNLLIAQNTINDAANATVAVPLTWLEPSKGRAPRYIASSNLTFGRTELITDTEAQPQGTFYVARIDVGVSYATRPNAVFALRYALTHQVGDAAAVMAAPSFTTNTVTFTFSYRYPDTTPVIGKKQKSMRADGSDIDPLNARKTQDDDGGDEKGVGGNVEMPDPPGAPNHDDDD